MTGTASSTRSYVTADTYATIQQFYARQMQLLDAGEAELWAGTFTEDGVFEETDKGEPLRGRAVIAASARARADEIAGDDRVRRHWLGMIDAEPMADGSVITRYYALAMATPRGGRLEIYVSCDCTDVLVPDLDNWLVRSRSVRLDGA